MRGYLFYERSDATVNARFIEQLQLAAKAQQIELQLGYPDELQQLQLDVDFVWNRSRQAAVSYYFEAKNVRVFNNAKTNEIANDKLLATRFVERLHIETVPTWQQIEQITAYPVVVKSIDGHGGKEVRLCESEVELHQQLEQLRDKSVIFQPYIEANAQDVHVWMLGTTIIGAVLRTGKNDFKSNYTLGGTIEKFELPKPLHQNVLTITEALRSDYIGIDFIKGVDGTFYFNEIEDPVGAKSYYDLYDDQLAKRLIRYIVQTIKEN
ncbi:MAG: ATP-grasp domain-containing protein [Lysinibacillus sp.]